MRESDNRLKREGSGLEHNYSHAGFLEEGAKLSHAYVTGSGKTRLLEQTKICVINVPNNRAEHCLHNDNYA